jgi:hypothetical protein
MANRVFSVALIVGTLMLITVCWVYIQHQTFGLGGIVLVVCAIVLIGMSVWRNIDVSVSAQGFQAKLEQVENKVRAVEEQAAHVEEKASAAYTAVRRLKQSLRVRDAQTMLSKQGFKVVADGIFGPQTVQAVKQFQLANGLAEAGELDEATMKALGVESMG